MYYLWDFCNFDLNFLFWRISTNLRGSPTLSFSNTKSMNASKLFLRTSVSQPCEINSISFSPKTEAKVLSQDGTSSKLVQNRINAFELSD